ncbi:MAG: four helix bundle protein [Candidatus Kerfeldbacteria bacterium CG_4_10_14_0_8_um_filter_42_10]|uniref:Four helix bundle protein n=1 Tax=Candidatus Kerfeldbacteria bacterium CG_4_10_14_0_8_um_filter_42_10 TaxID=2014248 RepID=A0A2M7RGQ5_9BACT|nr:MAG: four helix bundle protein [Candidatus Kerfeldbacteria bacterium CG_4_10_14_0_8_um_filter_42_10]
MIQITNSKHYDLEERTFLFAVRVKNLIKALPKNMINFEITKQLIRSACSIGANYLEANESLSKKDFVMRTKICKKEAKETRYWLRLLDCPIKNSKEKEALIQETIEFAKIFGSILEKCK